MIKAMTETVSEKLSFREPSVGERWYEKFRRIHSRAALPKFCRLRRVRPLKRQGLQCKPYEVFFVRKTQTEVVTRIFSSSVPLRTEDLFFRRIKKWEFMKNCKPAD